MLGVKTIPQFLIVLLGVYSCSAQNTLAPVPPCALTLKDIPVLEGFSLSMEISAVDSKSVIRKAEYSGEDFIKTEAPDSTYYLTFENKKLKLITVLYKSLKFDNLRRLRRAFEQGLEIARRLGKADARTNGDRKRSPRT